MIFFSYSPALNKRTTHKLHKLQLVLMRRLNILLLSNMGHITPVVSAIGTISRIRVIVDKSIDSSRSHDISQVVDNGCIWRIPPQISRRHRAVTCKGSQSCEET